MNVIRLAKSLQKGGVLPKKNVLGTLKVSIEMTREDS